MVNLGWVKARRKFDNQWVEGYIFKFDKFGDGEEVQYYVFRTGTNNEGDLFMERPVERYEVYGETVCHDTMWFADGNPIFVGDRLKQGDDIGTVVWSDNYNLFQVEVRGILWDLNNFVDAEIIDNIYDDFVPVEVVLSSITTEDVVKEIDSEDYDVVEYNPT
jgi:hypothetical protein